MIMKNFNIGTRLTIGFALVILLMLAVGGMALHQMGILAGLVNKIHNHPLTVGSAMQDIRFEINQMHSRFQRVYFVSDTAELNDVKQYIDDGEIRVLNKFELVTQRFLGDPNDVTVARGAFIRWKKDLDDQLERIRSGQKTVMDNRGYLDGLKHMDVLQTKFQVIINFAIGKAQGFLEETKAEQAGARKTMAGLLLALLLLSMIIAVLITRSIAPPLNRIVKHMEKIVEGDLRHDVEIARTDEIGILAKSFRAMQAGLRAKADVAMAIAAGDLDQKIEVSGRDDHLGNAINRMTKALRASKQQTDHQDWIKTGKNNLNRIIVGQENLETLAKEMLGFFADYLNAQTGTLYVASGNSDLVLCGSYALDPMGKPLKTIAPGQGIVGQVVLEKKIISVNNIPEDYLRISSSLGESTPRHLIAVPLLFEEKVQGVIELAAVEAFSNAQITFIEDASNEAAIAVHSVQTRAILQELLTRTQQQASQLQIQEEELRVANEELEEQARSLKESGEQLKEQQEKLETINQELEEKNQDLESQKEKINQKNQDLENARDELDLRARELAITSKFKSEFLANMSHELRTPLNSLLLLAGDLEENGNGNLNPDQVESAGVIHKSGLDLLQLINEVLDLSKIEAGRMQLNIDTVNIKELSRYMMQRFKHVADPRGLTFRIKIMKDLEDTIITDSRRLQQILTNLIGNALKFTEKGSVNVIIKNPAPDTNLTRSGLNPDTSIAFIVKDTGMGIPEDDQGKIFEAFQQGEGSSNRRFGGTGLGLSIARDLAKLLGGEIQLISQPGKGSTFTLFLPLAPAKDTVVHRTGLPVEPLENIPPREIVHTKSVLTDQPGDRVRSIPDDRDTAGDDDRFILIIEDDAEFAGILFDQCHRKGFKALVSPTGEEGLTLAEKFLPEAILLDIRLPGISGGTVLNTLKKNEATRHIPIHVISVEEVSLMALQRGAVGFTTKPVSREQLEGIFENFEKVIAKKFKDLLLVEDNTGQRLGIMKLLKDMDLNIDVAESGADALAAFKKKRYDCMILDLGLPDISGFELLNRLSGEQKEDIPPVIIYTGRDLTRKEEMALRKYAETIIVKGVKSEERLLDEVSLFLHKTVNSLPLKKQEMIINLHRQDAVFSGRTVLLVDDDMRNLFAMSFILEKKGLNVIKAEDGQKALECLDTHPEISMVLLDIMMPVLDGFQTAARIRSRPRFHDLPIIALTAKALKDDRNKCLEAGANDYLTKPVDTDRLFSMLKVWLYPQNR